MLIGLQCLKTFLPPVWENTINAYLAAFKKSVVKVKSLFLDGEKVGDIHKTKGVFIFNLFNIEGTRLYFYTMTQAPKGKLIVHPPLYYWFKKVITQTVRYPVSDHVKEEVERRFLQPDASGSTDAFYHCEDGQQVYISQVFTVNDMGQLHPSVTSSEIAQLPFEDFLKQWDDSTPISYRLLLAASLVNALVALRSRAMRAVIGIYPEDAEPVLRFTNSVISSEASFDFRVRCHSAVQVVPGFKLLTPLGLSEKCDRWESTSCHTPVWKFHISCTVMDPIIIRDLLHRLRPSDVSESVAAFYMSVGNLNNSGCVSAGRVPSGDTDQVSTIRILWMYDYGLPAGDGSATITEIGSQGAYLRDLTSEIISLGERMPSRRDIVRYNLLYMPVSRLEILLKTLKKVVD